MILDDEFIQKPVDEEGLKQIVRILKRDPFVGYILFTPIFKKGDGSVSKLYKRFNVIPRIRVTQSSANAGIWRKSKLLRYCRAGENIWQFETNSKQRRGLWDRCYSIKNGLSPIRTSFLVNEGYGIAQGRWLWKTEALLAEYGIYIDTQKRGIFTSAEADDKIRKHFDRKRQAASAPRKERIRNKMGALKDCMPVKLRLFLSKLKHIGR